MTMIRCTSCESENKDHQFFCDQCGKRLPTVKMEPKVSTIQEAGNVRNRNGQCNTMNGRDVVSVACGISYTVGLRKDGTVVATGWNKYGQCNTENWRDIVSVAGGNRHAVGLKKDGTVVATRRHDFGVSFDTMDTRNWRDIVSVACGDDFIVGLKKDGRFVAIGNNGDGQCNVRGLRT